MSWQLALLLASGCGRVAFDATTDAAAPDALECAAPYAFVREYCYRFMDTGTDDWVQQEQSCAADGAHLAVIDDAAELAALIELMTSMATVDASVGFSDRRAEGVYLTITGQPLFAIWASGEPTGTDENCGAVDSIAGAMRDRPCISGDGDRICELDGRSADPTTY